MSSTVRVFAPKHPVIQSAGMGGREEMKLSDRGRAGQRAPKVIRQIETGEMSPAFRLPQHPVARLTAAEKAQLIEGLRQSLLQEV